MVSCAHCNIQSSTVHIVIAGWLYVIGAIALTMKSAAAGIVTFALAGVAPVALYGWIALSRLRRRRAGAAARAAPPPSSGLEREVDEGDDRDA
jgi:hypothetical protein